MNHLCFHTDAIELRQTGFDKFTVVYGLSVKTGLNYQDAARALGESIMHNAACNGDLDNRTRKEALVMGDTKPVISA